VEGSSAAVATESDAFHRLRNAAAAAHGIGGPARLFGTLHEGQLLPWRCCYGIGVCGKASLCRLGGWLEFGQAKYGAAVRGRSSSAPGSGIRRRVIASAEDGAPHVRRCTPGRGGRTADVTAPDAAIRERSPERRFECFAGRARERRYVATLPGWMCTYAS
jgi:hypothetical protein